MARAKKTEEKMIEKKEVVEKKVKKPQPPVKQVPMKRALSLWRKRNPQRAMFFEDIEAIELFVKRHIPSLVSTQNEFDKVFEKF